METKEKVRKFLGRFVAGKEFDDEVNIFETGLVNSLFVMQLVMFIETEFGITIETEDLLIDNFKSVNSIADFVEPRMN